MATLKAVQQSRPPCNALSPPATTPMNSVRPMKRASDTEKSTDDASSSGRNQPKRPKSSQACSSCRKHKTRCELIDGHSEGPYRCHRCKVLNISCSFESSDFVPPLQSTSTSSPTFNLPSYVSDPATISPPNISGDRTASHPNNDNDRVKLEDLLPLPHKPWGFMKVPGGFDWTTTPMLAMQYATINRPHLDEDQISSNINASLASILSPDKVKSLLDIFESAYSPWLNLQPNKGGDCPILTLARCMVASRHLDTVTRASVVPQLQRLTEMVVYRHLFQPIPSIQSIQAILILSLWSPVGGQAQVEVHDGRLLIGSVVSMAMNQRLSQAVEYVARLREDIKNNKYISDSIMSDMDDAMDKARLWLSLMNAESMLCIGTGRAPLSHRTPLDLTVIDSTSSATVESGRDMRLSLMGQIFEITEVGLRITFSSKSEFGRFYKDVVAVLVKLDDLLRLISPLPVVVDHESFYYHILRIYHHTCRLLFIHHCLQATRRVIASGADQPWYTNAEYNGINIATHWGREALLLAEDILSSTISRTEMKQLGAAPDNVFAMLCFAASFIVTCKIAVYQVYGDQLRGASDGLLEKINDRLIQAACSQDHAPAKCARLIKRLVASFEACTMKGGGECEHVQPQDVPHSLSSERTSATDQIQELTGFSAGGQPHFEASLPDHGSSDGVNWLMHSDVMLDSDFWASFMDNLTTDLPYVEGIRSG